MEEIAYELNQIVSNVLNGQYKDKEEVYRATLDLLIGNYIKSGSEIKTVYGMSMKITG